MKTVILSTILFFCAASVEAQIQRFFFNTGLRESTDMVLDELRKEGFKVIKHSKNEYEVRHVELAGIEWDNCYFVFYDKKLEHVSFNKYQRDGNKAETLLEEFNTITRNMEQKYASRENVKGRVVDETILKELTFEDDRTMVSASLYPSKHLGYIVTLMYRDVELYAQQKADNIDDL